MSKNPESNTDQPIRTRQIDIADDTLSHQSIQNAPITFHLGSIQPAQITPKASPIPTPEAQLTNTVSNPERMVFGITPPPVEQPKNTLNSPFNANQKSPNKPATKSSGLSKRIWHLLEFISLTGAIFMVFFLIINFDSYSQLFFSKLDQIKGKIGVQNYYSTPVTGNNNDLKNSATPVNNTKPLPITQNVELTKRQIPALNMEITPPDFRIVIPRIAKNVPVVPIPMDKLIQKDWAALENQIQDGLKNGVVHFPGTAYPGQKGNVVITGHSSYFPWDAGRFKDVFALLHQVNLGDQVIVFDDQHKYVYEVYEKKVVTPDKVEVLTQSGDDRLTLITCTPVGTNLKRLVILAKPVN